MEVGDNVVLNDPNAMGLAITAILVIVAIAIVLVVISILRRRR